MTDPIAPAAAEASPPPAATGTPADTVATVAVKRPRAVFAGYTAGQLAIGAAILAMLVWGMWVTKALTGPPPQRIVKADLSRIVGDYVSAQARSATPPDQVQAQMRAFMASLDGELQRRGAAGEVVLVGEAVLTKSVPDITPDVVKAVYASGVRMPQPATRAQMGAMLNGQVPTSAPAQLAQPQMAAPPIGEPQAAAGPFGPMAPQGQVQAPVPAGPMMAGASVSSFGGPDGVGGQ